MKVTQVAELTNNMIKQVLGDEATLLNEDLSNVVDVGKAFFDVTNVDNYVRTLIDHIGKMIFVDRPYRGSVPSVMMDAWEFGAILEKVSVELMQAEVNESWELQNGASYDPNIFYKPEVTAKLFDKKVTFEIPISIAEKQVKSAFSSGTELNKFYSMIYNAVENSITLRLDELIMSTINSFTAETIYNEYEGAALSTKSGVKVVNLLYLYKQRYSSASELTAEDAITDPDFIRFASYKIRLLVSRLKRMSKLYNIEKRERFTSSDKLHLVLLAEFKAGADVFLQSDTFNKELTALPMAEEVPYWQGVGETGDDFSINSGINVKTPNNHTVTASGIIGVAFDTNALGVSNLDRRAPSNYNAKGEFFTNFYKFDAGYFNDHAENFIVFCVA